MRQLTKKGLNQKEAIGLVVSFPERCKQQLEWLPHRSNVQNPGQFLFMSITHNYTLSVVEAESAKVPAFASQTELNFMEVLKELHAQTDHMQNHMVRSAKNIQREMGNLEALTRQLREWADKLG